MTYKGIELKEFESEKPVLFDPPKLMLVWDSDDETPIEVEVIAFIPNRYYKVIEQTYSYIHCAEIPDKGSEMATNRELAKWIAHGNGQIHCSGGIRTWIEHNYDIGRDNDACPNIIKVRKWGDNEWHRPTREYLGLED